MKEQAINKTVADDSITVTFSLGRRLLSTFMTVYVPTLLLNIIALTTNYFKVPTHLTAIAEGYMTTVKLSHRP